MKAKHRAKCKSTYRMTSKKTPTMQRIPTGDGEYVIFCDNPFSLNHNDDNNNNNRSPSPVPAPFDADPISSMSGMPSSIKVVTPEELNNSIKQARLPEFQPTVSIPPLKLVRSNMNSIPHYQISATITPVQQQQQQGLFVPQSNSIYLPPSPAYPQSPNIDSSLQTINQNIIQAFEVIMKVNQAVEKLQEDMVSVKAYIDKEKDMIPVLITDKQNVQPAPQPPPPQLLSTYMPPIVAAPRIAPSSTTTINLPPVKNAFTPQVKNPIRPMIRPARPMMRPQATQPVRVPATRAPVPRPIQPPPPQLKQPVPMKKALPPPPPEPIVIEETLESEQFVEETIEFLQGDDRDSPILEVRDNDPLLDLEFPIGMDLSDAEVEIQTTEPSQDINLSEFRVTSLEEFNKANELLEKNKEYKCQLKVIFDAGRDKKTESFSNWFSDEFLDTAVWSTPQNRIFGRVNCVELRDMTLTKLLEESWAGDQTFRFQEFVRLQLYNAKTRIVKKKETARREINLSKSRTTITAKIG